MYTITFSPHYYYYTLWLAALHLMLSKSAKLSKLANPSDVVDTGFKNGSKASWVFVEEEKRSGASKPAALKGSAVAGGAGTGGAGAALVGPGLVGVLPTFGGAGRGGGALPFLGGRAGVGLSGLGGALPAKGSAPKGSASKPWGKKVG